MDKTTSELLFLRFVRGFLGLFGPKICRIAAKTLLRGRLVEGQEEQLRLGEEMGWDEQKKRN